MSTTADGGWKEGVGATFERLNICLVVSCDYVFGDEVGVGGAHGFGKEADMGVCDQ